MMTVGKILALVMFVCTCMGAKLEITDLADRPINKVSQGKPFYATVNLDTGDARNCLLKGVEQFSILSTSKSVNTVLGAGEKSYKIKYKLSANQMGSYSIGPATITTSNGEMVTNIENVEVVVGFPHLEMKVKKTFVLEKEPFEVVVKFYSDQVDMNAKLQTPENIGEGLKLIKVLESVDGKEIFNNQESFFREWKLLVKTNKAGQLKLEPINALFEQKEEDTFGGFFMPRSYTHRITSNPVWINSKALPDSDLDAVGIFKSFNANLNSKNAVVDDAVVLTLEVEGEGYLDDVEYSKLQLPEQLSFYQSKSFVKDNKKYFEFVIQGKEAGEYKIPQQIFTYFDLNKRACSALKSNTLDLKIEIRNSLPIQSSTLLDKDLLPACQEFVFGANTAVSIPFTYFVCLLFLPLILLIGFYFKKALLANKKVDPVSIVRKRIKSAVQASELLQILLKSGLSKDAVSKKLTSKNCSQAVIDNWRKLWAELEVARYSTGSGLDENLNGYKAQLDEVLQCL